VCDAIILFVSHNAALPGNIAFKKPYFNPTLFTIIYSIVDIKDKAGLNYGVKPLAAGLAGK
jgi:hypothetical protein